jgi:hypothetical protein
VSKTSGDTLRKLITRYHLSLLSRNQDQAVQASLEGLANEEFVKLNDSCELLTY